VRILTVGQMRQVEQDCAKIGISTGDLMENAGKAVAEEVRRIMGGNVDQMPVLVMVGQQRR
jgi:NAD(P)H-hydrate repair Nnr-like enzyme with NAD(P)H-hydrate epimerase domain